MHALYKKNLFSQHSDVKVGNPLVYSILSAKKGVPTQKDFPLQDKDDYSLDFSMDSSSVIRFLISARPLS